MRIGIGTCRVLPEEDMDADLLANALRAAGCEPVFLAWDEDAPLPDVVLSVIRSTWNYFEDRAKFVRWAKDLSARAPLFNSANVVEWNSHKSYLGKLHSNGIEVVPTMFVEEGARLDLAEFLRAAHWEDRIVIKPAVSAGSFQTRRFDRNTLAEGQTFLDELTRERDMTIQPFMPAIETRGERSLVWIDGTFTHAVRKSLRLANGEESVSPCEITHEERTFGDHVLTKMPFDPRELLYARVDVIPDQKGALRLMELELIEPSLFFVHHPPALAQFVDGIIARARQVKVD